MSHDRQSVEGIISSQEIIVYVVMIIIIGKIYDNKSYFYIFFGVYCQLL